MSRVVIGPYREGLSLRNLFTAKPGESLEIGENDQVEDAFVRMRTKAVSSAVLLTEDWAERQNDWDPEYQGIIVTENDLKHWENDHPLRYTSFALETKKSFIAGPDSLETEQTAIDIARGKTIVGLLEPVQDATTKEIKEAIEAIGAKDAKHILVMSEDREMMVPKILKDASVWDPYREMMLVRECFEDGEAFPGKRVNELQNAVGGALNLLSLLEQARDEMLEKGYEVPDTHTSYVSYYMKFLEYDETQPLPEEGLFITASERNRRFLPVLQKHIDMERAGLVDFDLNDFDVPADYHGLYDDEQKPITIETLRADPQSRYFSHQFASARAMRAFVDVMGIPILDKPREHKMEDMDGATLISNLNFGEINYQNDYEGQVEVGLHLGSSKEDMTLKSRIFGTVEDIPQITSFDENRFGSRYVGLEQNYRIENHEDLELGFTQADGTIVEKWPEKAPEGVDQDLYELEQKILARMVIANRTTLKPLAEATALGRPIMIDHSVRSSEMPAYHNAVKFRTITARSDHVFRGFSDASSFKSVMAEGQWDKEHMKEMPIPSQYHLIDEDDLADMLGGADVGFTEALLGSASSHLKSGNEDALTYTYESAKKTMTMTHGGGGRFIMGKFFEGAIHAMEEGHDDFLSIAMRVPIASRKEGSLKPLLRRYDLDVEAGGHDSDYLMFGKGHFHVATFEQMGERQHAIIAPAHVVTSFIGGIGTDYEYETAMYHNLMVEMRGYGIFPGFEGNDQKKRLHFVNSPVMNGGNHEYGYFDALKESLTEEQWEILDAHFYDTPEAALEARNQHAADLGYDLDAPRAGLHKTNPRHDGADHDDLTAT